MLKHQGFFQGDSGGPLVCQNKYGRWELVGVASFGKRGCRGDQIPVIYQSVPYHIDWILQNTGMILYEVFI